MIEGTARFSYTCGDRFFQLTFPYDPDMVSAVKSVYYIDRTWNAADKIWSVRNGLGHLELLASLALNIFEHVVVEVTQPNGEVQITNMRTGQKSIQGSLFAESGDGG